MSRSHILFRQALLAVPLLAALAEPAAALTCLAQKTLPAGCVAGTGALGCSVASALDAPWEVEISPDGEAVYTSNPRIVVLDRDTATGALTPLAGTAACISNDGSGGTCTDGRNLHFPNGMALVDGPPTAYVGSFNGLAVFDRVAATGQLTQKAGTAGCINGTGAEGCAVSTTLGQGYYLAASPDGRSLYVSTSNNGVAIFDRDTMTGAVTQKAGTAGCVTEDGTGGACVDGVGLGTISDLVVSPDGKNLYTVALVGNAIAVFDRDTMTGALTQKAGTAGCISEDGSGGACTDGSQLVQPSSAAISPDGRHLYVVAGYTGSSNSLSIFDRDTMTGALTQKAGMTGCVSNNGSGGACIDARGMQSPRSLVVTPDGETVYVGLEDSDGVAVFQRDLVSGLLTQVPGAAGCVNRDGSDGCTVGVGMRDSLGMVGSPDGSNLYVSGNGDDAIAVFDSALCPPPPPTTTTTTTTSTTTTTLPAGACPSLPLETCRDQSGKARVTMRVSDEPSGSSLEFVWKRGEATTLEAFGDPAGGATVTSLCVYGPGGPLAEVVVPGGGTCGSRPCWRTAGRNRVLYFDRSGAADGARELVLRSGADGESKVRAMARGVDLALPPFPVTPPLRVQLRSDTGGNVECWDASFSTLRLNSVKKVEGIR